MNFVNESSQFCSGFAACHAGAARRRVRSATLTRLESDRPQRLTETRLQFGMARPPGAP